MNNKTFILISIIFLCIFLTGILVGATIAAKAQRDIDNRKIEELTERNLRVLERVENLQAVIENMLGPGRTEDMPIARPGTGD